MLKLSTLKYWIGREWSKGKLTEGCNALTEAAVFFFNPEREQFQTQEEHANTRLNHSSPQATPAIFTPSQSSSNRSTYFFGPSQPINNQILENDDFEDKMMAK